MPWRAQPVRGELRQGFYVMLLMIGIFAAILAIGYVAIMVVGR